MKKQHHIIGIALTNSTLAMEIDGQRHEFRLDNISKRLSNANLEEKNHFEVTPSGYGIHWPLIDEDLSIDGLLGIAHQPPEKLAEA